MISIYVLLHMMYFDNYRNCMFQRVDKVQWMCVKKLYCTLMYHAQSCFKTAYSMLSRHWTSAYYHIQSKLDNELICAYINDRHMNYITQVACTKLNH